MRRYMKNVFENSKSNSKNYIKIIYNNLKL